MSIDALAAHLGLGVLLDELRRVHGGYQLLDHWQQGEFHHDIVVKVDERGDLPGEFLVVATNCNGGVKEVLCFTEPPTRGGLWHARCPDNPEFVGSLPVLVGSARTMHWFDPCELLRLDARSEYRAEERERQPGGGWQARAGKP